MTCCLDYDDYEFAIRALDIINRITGDRCCLLRVSCLYWKIVRYDPAGKEVQWE